MVDLDVIISATFLFYLFRMAYTNDVLCFIDINIKRATQEKIIYLGKGIFPESAINEAKQCLLNECEKYLS